MPNAVDGHDSPELEIYGMDGIPVEDLKRHLDGLPIVPYTKSKLIIGDSSILPILAAQKVSVAAQLAESKNLTVSGEMVSPVMSGAPLVSPVLSAGAGVGSSSGTGTGVIISPPVAPVQLPVQNPSVTSPPQPNPSSTAYWNNPYMMAAYYQQQQQGSGNNPANQAAVAAAYAQYYQNYYQAYASNYYSVNNASGTSSANLNPSNTPESSTSNNNTINSNLGDQTLVIPSYVDPKTNKLVPGTIFTVLDLERSMEELRSELKKYKLKK